VDKSSLEAFAVLAQNLASEVDTYLVSLVRLLALEVKNTFLELIEAILGTSALEAFLGLEANRNPFKDCVVGMGFLLKVDEHFHLKVVLHAKKVIDQSLNFIII